MEKSKKLKNYSDKNYAEIITFPVELVGRDGVVRRYTYEDSMRIYRRRIDSAHLRYQDKDIIRAEVHHCSRRLEQIQRSWRQRIYRSEQHYIERVPDPAQRAPYEQGKAFLQSYMGGVLSEVGEGAAPTPNLVLLTEVPPCRVFYVNHPGFRAGTLLYVFDLQYQEEGEGGLTGQRAFEEYGQMLQLCGPAPDVEKLIHEEQADDYGFILTNPHPDIRADDLGALHRGGGQRGEQEVPVTDRGSFLVWLDGILHDAGIPAGSPVKHILATLGMGDLDQAYEQCKEAVEFSPYNQRAYWIMGALSEILGRWDETEAYMLMACHYFPGDPQSELLAGLHRLRMGDPRVALEHLERARTLSPELPCLHALMVRAYGAAHDVGRARAMLLEGRNLHPDDGELQMLEANFDQLGRWNRGLLAGAVALTVTGMWITLTWSGLALPVMVGVVAGLGGLWAFFRRRERSWFEALD